MCAFSTDGVRVSSYVSNLNMINTYNESKILRIQCGITKSAQQVFELLANMTNKHAKVFPSINTMASALTYTPLTIRRAIKQLQSIGILSKQERFTKSTGRQTSNEYFLHIGSECYPLHIGKKIKTILSIRKLWAMLMDKKQVNHGTEMGQLIDTCLDAGDPDPMGTIGDWMLYWREHHPDRVFTLDAWRRALAGWIANRANLFPY